MFHGRNQVDMRLRSCLVMYIGQWQAIVMRDLQCVLLVQAWYVLGANAP